MYFFILFIIEVIILTNINCSENCIYQKDGKCSFENINQQKITSHKDCAYFISNSSITNSVCSKKNCNIDKNW